MTTRNRLDPMIDYLKRIDLRQHIGSVAPGISTTRYFAKQNGGTADLYCSPFREDKHPSFGVYVDGAYDFTTNESFDIISIYQKSHNCDFPTAVKELYAQFNGGKIEPSSITIVEGDSGFVPRKKPVSKNEMTERIKNSLNALDKALPYLNRRGISHDFAIFAWMGVYVHTRIIEIDLNNKPIRYTRYWLQIPYWRTENDKLVVDMYERRRLDDLNESSFFRLSDEHFDLLVTRNGLNPDKNKYDLAIELNEIYTPSRYKSEGERMYAYNRHLLYNFDTKRLYKQPYIILTESALDSAMLVSLGYKAISIPVSNNTPYKKILSNVQRVIALEDNDEAGKKKMATITASCQHKTEYVTTPSHKDIGDLYIAEGAEGVHKFMEELGIRRRNNAKKKER